MSRARYSHSGMDAATYGDIPSNSVFDISGMGHVTIQGKIGGNTLIKHSGMGKLNINGEVSETAVFDISGMGHTIFAKKLRKKYLIIFHGPVWAGVQFLDIAYQKLVVALLALEFRLLLLQGQVYFLREMVLGTNIQEIPSA